MIMKLICTGDDRQEAIALSMAALEELLIDGVSHNAEFAKAMLKDNDFVAGNVHTKWIEKVFLNRWEKP